MSFLPGVIRAEHRGGYRIHVRFNDNTEKTIDFGRWLQGPVFEPLKDPDYFKKFFLDGGTIAWPNGADIAPETLYEYYEPSSSKKTRPQPSNARVKTAGPQQQARRRS
jgi:hypothetical protein